MKRTSPYLLFLFIVAFILAGCAVPSTLTARSQSSQAATPSVASAATSSAAASSSEAARTVTVTVTRDATSSVAATTSSSANPAQVDSRVSTATSSTASGAATAPSAEVSAAIKQVITRANAEQQQAFANHDATLMRDTATTSYYNELVQTNRDMTNGGVSAISLVKLEWGPVSLTGNGGAQATTFETWATSYVDGTSNQSRDRNVYTLVQESGAWKIQADAHPDSGLDQLPPGTSPSVTSPGGPGSSPLPTPRISPTGVGQSRNWSGYAATGGTFTSVTGTWTVPSASATGNPGADATWVGIGGVQSRDLIQAGTENTVGAGQQVQTDAWVERLPQTSHPVSLPVKPGDSITVTISQQSAGTWLIAFKNNTTGQTYQTTEQYDSSMSSAEWVEEAPSGGRRVVPLDDFGSVHFAAGSATKDGKSVTIAQSGATPITMIDGTGTPLATPSKLTASGGFDVTQSAPSTAPGISPTVPRFRIAPGGAFGY